MNAKNLFLDGIKPELEEVLENRERRVHFIRELLRRYPLDSVISLKCNIPGPIKKNEGIQLLFDYGKTQLLQILAEHEWNIEYEKCLDLPTGPEGFWVIPKESLLVKQKMIEFEEQRLGRLFDADVLDQKEGTIRSRSRVELGYPPRRCLICDNDARTCASRRLHPVPTLQKQLTQLLEENRAELKAIRHR